MRALTGELLLAAWDEGTDKHALARSLILLALALPESDWKQLAQLTIAERNLLLLRMHHLSFGPVLQGFGVCSQCSAQLEFTVPVTELIDHVKSQLCEGPMVWAENGRQYQLRAVTSSDLLFILDAPGATEAQQQLLKRCLNISGEASVGEDPSECAEPSGAFSPAAIPGILGKFDQLHAAAELTCAVQCAACSHREALDLDIAEFAWIEVRSAAKRLLTEIHELAWAYGWSEDSILRMSSQRRSAYMEMLSG